MSDTIAAIATALSPSGIGIIRISGENSIDVADRIFVKPKHEKLKDLPSHTIHYGHVVENGEMIDEVLVLLMRAPHSFTGEDVVEVDCHGGVYVLKRILNLILKSGARLAEPGEFTKRAFLNGRIDLSKAEAVMDLISSGNENARKNSMGQLSGRLHDKIVFLREKILYEIAYIESAIDDPEHYDMVDFHERLSVVTDEICLSLDRLNRSFENGKMMLNGIQTTIVGKPNVGKSSFLNLILGEERAIVTSVAGTTRDTLEENVSLDGVSLHLVDTAGIHETEDEVELIGVEKAKKSIENAELIIFVLDASKEISEEDKNLIPLLEGKSVIVLLNKSDLWMDEKNKEEISSEKSSFEEIKEKNIKEKNIKENNIKEKNINENSTEEYVIKENSKKENCLADGYKKTESNCAIEINSIHISNAEVKELFEKYNPLHLKILPFSAKTSDGLNELSAYIKDLFFEGKLNTDEEIYLTSIRHKNLVEEALTAMDRVKDSLANDMPEDFYSIDLMQAYASLGGIIGEEVDDDLVDEIFSKFCMGK